jgi:hypothetical protein
LAKLLRRLAGRSDSASGDGGALAGQERVSKRRERGVAVGNRLPSAWVKMQVWTRDGGRCVQCGRQERVWVCYIVPVWEGGSPAEQNMRLMCEHCSRRNRDKRVRRRKLRA